MKNLYKYIGRHLQEQNWYASLFFNLTPKSSISFGIDYRKSSTYKRSEYFETDPCPSNQDKEYGIIRITSTFFKILNTCLHRKQNGSLPSLISTFITETNPDEARFCNSTWALYFYTNINVFTLIKFSL